jgi:hypothetical protein
MAERVQKYLAPASIVLLIPIAVGLWIKLHYAADVTDESFYLATTDSLISWHKPFVMNVNYAQTASLLMIPFVVAYRTLCPSGEGIVFALRLAYIVLAGGTAVFTFRFAKQTLGTYQAVLLSYVPLVWIPFSLPTLSYNTIGMNFLAIALLLASTGSAKSQAKWLVVAALFFVALVAYPSLAMPVGIFYAAGIWLARDETRTVFLRSVLFLAALIGAAFCVALAWSSWPALSRTLQLIQDVAKERAATRFADFCQELSFKFVGLRLLLMMAIGLGLTKQRKARIRSVLLIGLALTFVYIVSTEPALFMASHEIITGLALACSFCFLGLGKESEAGGTPALPLGVEQRLPVLSFWISIVAGMGSAWSSNNGFMNFAIGATPAVIFGLCALVRRFEQREASDSRFNWQGAFLLVSVIAALFLDACSSVYGEYGAHKSDLTYKLETGPFKGLHTTPERGRLLTQLQVALARCQGDTIYVIGPPGVYLLARQKPLDLTLFHRDNAKLGAYKSFFESFFAERVHQPDLIVKVEDEWFGQPNAVDEQLLRHYQPLIKDKDAGFSILKRAD